MAKRNLSRHQKKIVERYYEHRDTIAVNKLGEIVSELYLTDSAKKQNQLWERAATQLKHTDADAREVQRICDQRDLQALAQLVNDVS